MFLGEVVDNKYMKILNRCSIIMLLAISVLIVDTNASAQNCPPGYIPTYSRGPNGERGAFLKCIKKTDFQNHSVDTNNYQQAYSTCQAQGRYTIDTGTGFRCGGLIQSNSNDHVNPEVEEKIVAREKVEKVSTVKADELEVNIEADLSSIKQDLEARRRAEELQKQVCEKSDGQPNQFCSLHAPLPRIIAGGLMSTITGIVWSETNKEVHRIDDNIKNLEKIRDAIVDNQGKGLNDCSEADFNNSEKPHCYCYTPGGSINRSRDPVGVCAALFPYYRPPVVSNTPTLRGCVRLDGSFDRDCQCRQQVSNGQNNCMKLQSISTAGLGENAIGAIGDAGRAANNIFSGNYAGASTYNPTGARSLARLGKRQAEKAIKKASGTIDKVINDKIKAIVNNPKIAGIAKNADQRNAGISSIASGLPGSLKSELDKKTGGIISKADKGYSGGGGNRKRGRLSDNDSEIDFGESVDFSVDMNDEKAEEIMAKNFNYKNSDVFQRSSASIFKVLSVRYQRSAYRRLFKEEDVIEVDKPNDNDIRR